MAEQANANLERGIWSIISAHHNNKEMVMHEDNDRRNEQEEVEHGRRDFLKGSAAATGAGLAATTVPGVAAAQANSEPQNLYGPRPRREHQPAGVLPALARHQEPQYFCARQGNPPEERDADLVHGQHPVPGIPGAVGIDGIRWPA